MTRVDIGNSNLRGAGSSNREDLENMISNVDRKKAPFCESIGKTTATNALHEWHTDEYGTPIVPNHAEGGGFTSDSTTARSRLGNYVGTGRKDVAVSGLTEDTNRNGIASEMDYQVKKAVVEIRQGYDVAYLRHTNTVADGGQVAFTTTPTNLRPRGVFAYMEPSNMKWLGSSVALTLDNGSGTALTGSGNVVSATGNPAAPTNYASDGSNFVRYSGTGAALARADIEEQLEDMYINGAEPNMLMTPASQKSHISGLFVSNSTTSAAERKLTSAESKVNVAVSGVMTDFGNDVMLVPNYLFRNATGYALAGSGNDSIIIYESGKLKRAQMRAISAMPNGRDGDQIRTTVLGRETLVVENPKCVGTIQNIT